MHPGYDIITLPEVDSTNTYIVRRPELFKRDHLMVRAVVQTDGRGRRGRSWHQSPGLDLAFSLLHRLPASDEGRNLITLRAGLAAFRALAPIAGSRLRVKWPNDIYHDGKKLGGILCEYIPEENGGVAVIGIGINVNSTRFPSSIAPSATSLKLMDGNDRSPEDIMILIADELCILLEGGGTLSDDEYAGITGIQDLEGKTVRFFRDGREAFGTAVGIRRDGTMLILHEGKELILDGDAIIE